MLHRKSLNSIKTLNFFRNGILSISSGSNLQNKRSVNNESKIFAYTPTKAHPYIRLMRMDKPIGSWLLFLPCAWSTCLAAPIGSLPDLYLLSLFGAGSILMRGAACVVNDMWDHDVDKLVERTKNRPLASGEISLGKALVLANLLCFSSLVILFQLNSPAIILSFLSVPMVLFYPLCKRIIKIPQLFLASTINFGALIGYTACTGIIDLNIIFPLYFACINWTLVYDTIYAHQDKKYDESAGIASSALHLGEKTKFWCYGFTATMAVSLTTCGYFSDSGVLYYALVYGVMLKYIKEVILC